MYRQIGLTVLLLFTPIAIALAQSPRPPEHETWELSVSGGVSFIGSKQFVVPLLGHEPRTLGMTFKKGYQVATRIGQNLGNRWGAELTYSYIHHKMLLANPQPNLASLEFGHTIHRFDYDMLLYMLGRSSRVRPFAIAGSGVALFRTPEVGKSHAADAGVQVMDRIKLSINWGGGLKCLVHENVAIRFEFSDRMTGVPNYAFVPGFKATGMLHDRMLNLGLVYYWRTR